MCEVNCTKCGLPIVWGNGYWMHKKTKSDCCMLYATPPEKYTPKKISQPETVERCPRCDAYMYDGECPECTDKILMEL